MAFLPNKKTETILSPISGSDLVDKLYETWGKRWLVDRLLLINRGVENDWIEFKATFCPPEKLYECPPVDNMVFLQFSQGDYYLQVVKSVMSMINLHGGVILLGVEKHKGTMPVPADEQCLCESDFNKPIPVSNQYFEWDTDNWQQYICKIFKQNEWIDRYDRIWNCSEILDDKYIKLYKGILHNKPVIVIAVSPTEYLPVEFKLNVHIGKRPGNSKENNGQSEIKHCIRRVTNGVGCHWPYDDPDPIEPSVIPLRMRGDTASIDMKWSYSEVTKLWKNREPSHIRFNKILEEEIRYYKSLPYGLMPAIESILNYNLKRIDRIYLVNTRVKDEVQKLILTNTHTELKHCLCNDVWLILKNSNVNVLIYVNLIKNEILSYQWGNNVPIYFRFENNFDKVMMKYLFENNRDFIEKYFLHTLTNNTVVSKEHLRYLIKSYGIHLTIENIDILEEETVKRFLTSIKYFKELYPNCFITIISGPISSRFENIFECAKLSIDS